MQQAIVDCATGETTYVPLSDAEQVAVATQQRQAQAQAQVQAEAQAQETAFRLLLREALGGVAGALHGSQATADAAALAGLVHKLCADPPHPLSAPELATLARFVLRCLLP